MQEKLEKTEPSELLTLVSDLKIGSYQNWIVKKGIWKKRKKRKKSAQLTSGLNMCISPSVAPGKVIPRIKNMVMTMYGNPAVK